MGKPTVPEDHSDHGADSWRDYFRFNTDHKVIGIQYIVTTFVFFFIGGLLAMGIRAELAQPGTQVVDPAQFNGLFSTHAAIMIFLFVIPVFAGIANYVLPLMLGAPDMAFPRLNALSLLDAAVRGHSLHGQLRRPGRRLRRRLDRLRAAFDGRAARAVVLQHRRPVRRLLVDLRGDQLPGHDRHACARRG